jgi:hypothetical protein
MILSAWHGGGKRLMNTEREDRLATVWHEVRSWSAPERLALASRILQSLERDQARESPDSAADLIGLWRTEPTPTDEEIEQIVEEEKLRKHG